MPRAATSFYETASAFHKELSQLLCWCFEWISCNTLAITSYNPRRDLVSLVKFDEEPNNMALFLGTTVCLINSLFPLLHYSLLSHGPKWKLPFPK